MNKQYSKLARGVAAALAVGALSAPVAQADAGLSGSLGVVSKYVLRGGTMALEHDGAAVQAGISYDTGTGFTLGWWGSSLGYNDPGEASGGFENDFTFDYSMELGGVTLGLGAVYYYYLSIEDANVLEPYVNVGFGPVTFGAKYLADDVVWGNKGDTYLTLGFSQDLPSDFSFSAVAGYYLYETDGEFIAETPDSEDSGFKHLDLTLSHPLGKTGLDMSITYIVGGDDRFGDDLKNTMVLGVSGSF